MTIAVWIIAVCEIFRVLRTEVALIRFREIVIEAGKLINKRKAEE